MRQLPASRTQTPSSLGQHNPAPSIFSLDDHVRRHDAGTERCFRKGKGKDFLVLVGGWCVSHGNRPEIDGVRVPIIRPRECGDAREVHVLSSNDAQADSEPPASS